MKFQNDSLNIKNLNINLSFGLIPTNFPNFLSDSMNVKLVNWNRWTKENAIFEKTSASGINQIRPSFGPPASNWLVASRSLPSLRQQLSAASQLLLRLLLPSPDQHDIFIDEVWRINNAFLKNGTIFTRLQLSRPNNPKKLSLPGQK